METESQMSNENRKPGDRGVESRNEETEPSRVYDPGDETELSPDEVNQHLKKSFLFSNRIRTLSEVYLRIDGGVDRAGIIEILAAEVYYFVEHDFGFLALLTPGRNTYEVHALPSLAYGTRLDGKHFHVSEGMAGWVINHKRFILTDLDSCPAYHEDMEGALAENGFKHLLAIPLQTSDDTIGCLVLSRVEEKPFESEEIWIAQLLSLQVAIALKNRELFEDVNKRITQIEMAHEIAENLTSTLDLDDLLSLAAETIRKTRSYFDVTIFLVQPEGGALLAAHSGSYTDFLPHGYRQELNEGIVGWVVKHGEKALVNDVTKDPRYVAYEYHNTQSELAVPIRIEGKVVGVVNVEDTRIGAFDETDAKVLETVCDQLGSMINNARLYDQLQKTNATLTELDKMKSDFLGIVSHDFRTPLASIILAAKAMVKRGPELEELRKSEYLRIIVDQAERLKQLAEDTLSITRHERGQLAYHFELVNVERLVKDALNAVSVSRRHVIDPRVDPNVAYIYGDHMTLRQLITNLVSNAVKYSPRGGVVKVTVQPHEGGEVLFSVSDEGIGIPEEQYCRLFKKFSRVDTPEAREIKGSGLGLWICQEIVSGHGGKIWVESEPGRGTTFKFTLKPEQESR